ncbi:MAG: hypothetical protein HQ553_15485 [Chloroflexi bacterium]|nr:hypothetical protein [Chloroflexota bacterium]
MKSKLFALFSILIIMLCLTMITAPGCGDGDNETATDSSPEVGFDEALWNDPPTEYWPYVRWWWPGGAVDSEELKIEMVLLKGIGVGGVEVQAFQFGFTPMEIENDPAIRSVGTPEFFQKIRIVAEEADRLGMTFDFTLGSGWSSGGPFVSEAPERQLLMSSLDVNGPGSYEGTIPTAEPAEYRNIINNIIDALGPFDTNVDLIAVTAARIVDDTSEPPTLHSFQDITSFVQDDILKWDVPEGNWKIFAFYQNRTNHHPVGSAYSGSEDDALIMDHLDEAGIQEVIDGFAVPLLEACGEYAPQAVFVDSFEMVGELPWTTFLLETFRDLKGYDLTPYLPLVFQQKGESKYTEILHQVMGEGSLAIYVSSEIGDRVREDYEEVRAGMFLDNFVVPLRDWAHQNDLTLRLQSQGGWGDYLDVYEIADIPESEALFAGGTFDFMKLASSAAHTAGRIYTGLESFVSMNNDPRAQTIEDLHLLGGRAFSAGITRIIYHVFPYQYIRENGKRWYGAPAVHERDEYEMIAIGPIPFTIRLDENHQVWPDLSGFNKYLARLCYALTLGKNVADIAWLQPDWRVPDTVVMNIDGYLPEQGESEISLSLRRSGLTYDRVSRKGLTNAIVKDGYFMVGAARYEALLLNEFDVATPELMASIEEIAGAGIPVIVMGDLPGRAPGFVDWEERDTATQGITARLQSKVTFAAEESEVGSALLSAGMQPSLAPSDGGELAFAVVRRELPEGDIFFLFNESNRDRTQILDINVRAKGVRVLDPQTGGLVTEAIPDESEQLSIRVAIPAKRSLVLVAEH